MKAHAFKIERLKESEPIVSVRIDQELTLTQAIEALEQFLHAVGYRFPDKARLGFEYED
jgi:hypothetical protein